MLRRAPCKHPLLVSALQHNGARFLLLAASLGVASVCGTNASPPPSPVDCCRHMLFVDMVRKSGGRFQPITTAEGPKSSFKPADLPIY